MSILEKVKKQMEKQAKDSRDQRAAEAKAKGNA